MRATNTQPMSTIMVINDFIAPLTEPSSKDVQQTLDSLIHWEFPEEDEPCGKLSLSCGEWGDPSDEQEWRDDYTASIRL